MGWEINETVWHVFVWAWVSLKLKVAPLFPLMKAASFFDDPLSSQGSSREYGWGQTNLAAVFYDRPTHALSLMNVNVFEMPAQFAASETGAKKLLPRLGNALHTEIILIGPVLPQ
jgi:hypothetical protein